MLFNVTPDYAGLLSKKFSSFLEEDEACENSLNNAADVGYVNEPSADKVSDDEEDNEVPCLARGRKL